MRVTLNVGLVADREELHKLLANQLDLPDWYGRNLDALSDCLGDISADTELWLFGCDNLASNLGDYAERFFEVMRESTRLNPRLSLVLLRGKSEE